MTTEIQDRVADNLVANPNVGRADVREVTDGAIEVWLYDTEGVLAGITTIKPSGSYTTRPGFRVTTDTYVGRPEDRPFEDPFADPDPRADWSSAR